jgi:ADP-heptose:LPS heptosyltransferase
MKKTIIISPYSKKLRKAKPTDPDKVNPKNYPWWKEVTKQLQSKGYRVIQVGVPGEGPIGADEVKQGLKLKDLAKLLSEAATWASVDNFFNHFATYHGKRGVAVFGRSDPNIFGYAQNINLLKDRVFLRPQQFELWEQDVFTEQAFVDPDVVVAAIESIAN